MGMARVVTTTAAGVGVEMMGTITVAEVTGVLKANPSRKTMKSRFRCQQNPRNPRGSLCFSLDHTRQHFACSGDGCEATPQVPMVQTPGLICSGQLLERSSFT